MPQFIKDHILFMIKKIIASAIAVSIIIASVIYINLPHNESKEKTIEIIAINLNEEVIIDDTITTTLTTMHEILADNYDIEVRNGMLIKLESIYTPDTRAYFIKIYINDTLSTRGIDNMIFNDGDIIKFIESETYYYE